MVLVHKLFFQWECWFSLLSIQRVIRPYTRVYKEVALELKWHFNNRLNIDGTLNERNTRNVILSVPVSAASGVTNVLKNAGKHKRP
jgi:hypothetical protein